MAEHFVTLFEPSRQSNVPAVTGVVRPFRIKNESLSVVMVTSFAPDGVNAVAPRTERSALAETFPVTVNALFTVVVPVAAPRETVVAAPPIFKVVALELKTEAVPVEVVVISLPFNAKSPEEVIFPVNVDAPSTVKVPLAWILPVLDKLIPVEP